MSEVHRQMYRSARCQMGEIGLEIRRMEIHLKEIHRTEIRLKEIRLKEIRLRVGYLQGSLHHCREAQSHLGAGYLQGSLRHCREAQSHLGGSAWLCRESQSGESRFRSACQSHREW